MMVLPGPSKIVSNMKFLKEPAHIQTWKKSPCLNRVTVHSFWKTNFIGDITNLHPNIQGSLELPFSELFSPNALLWNQCEYIAFNIFSWRISIISYKMLIITGISNEKKINHIWNIMSKRDNILPTRNSFFISSAGKIKSVQDFKIKFFE